MKYEYFSSERFAIFVIVFSLRAVQILLWLHP